MKLLSQPADGYRYSLTLLLFVLAFNLNAQTEPEKDFKRFTLGGEFNLTNLDFNDLDNTFASAYLGYSLNKNFLIGANFTYSTEQLDQPQDPDFPRDIPILQGFKNYQFGIFSRYTFNANKKLSFYAELGANLNVRDPQLFQINSFNTNFPDTPFITKIPTQNDLHASFNLNFGIKYSVSSRFNILLDIGVLEYDFLLDGTRFNLNSSTFSPRLEYKF